MILTQENCSTRRETCPSAYLSTRNFTQTEVVSNPGLRDLNTNIKSDLHLKIQSVPRSKHSVSVIKTNQLMLWREIIDVCSKHINTQHGQYAETLNLHPAVYNVSFKVLILLYVIRRQAQGYSIPHTMDTSPNVLNAMSKYGNGRGD